MKICDLRKKNPQNLSLLIFGWQTEMSQLKSRIPIIFLFKPWFVACLFVT